MGHRGVLWLMGNMAQDLVGHRLATLEKFFQLTAPHQLHMWNEADSTITAWVPELVLSSWALHKWTLTIWHSTQYLPSQQCLDYWYHQHILPQVFAPLCEFPVLLANKYNFAIVAALKKVALSLIWPPKQLIWIPQCTSHRSIWGWSKFLKTTSSHDQSLHDQVCIHSLLNAVLLK